MAHQAAAQQSLLTGRHGRRRAQGAAWQCLRRISSYTGLDARGPAVCRYRHACRHVHRHLYRHVYRWECRRACVQTCVQACVQVCVQVCAHTCVHTCVHTCWKLPTRLVCVWTLLVRRVPMRMSFPMSLYMSPHMSLCMRVHMPALMPVHSKLHMSYTDVAYTARAEPRSIVAAHRLYRRHIRRA